MSDPAASTNSKLLKKRFIAPLQIQKDSAVSHGRARSRRAAFSTRRPAKDRSRTLQGKRQPPKLARRTYYFSLTNSTATIAQRATSRAIDAPFDRERLA